MKFKLLILSLILLNLITNTISKSLKVDKSEWRHHLKTKDYYNKVYSDSEFADNKDNNNNNNSNNNNKDNVVKTLQPSVSVQTPNASGTSFGNSQQNKVVVIKK